ncbi:MAG: hypothetical protein IJ468_11645 [Lachnospiraceae bacterium]|nr:hypothetical protein [Lachnospiraceae bacterium]
MDSIWWNQISNANRFIREVISAALTAGSLILVLPPRTPWYQSMYERIKNGLRELDAANSFERIPCPQEEIGRYFLDHYCTREEINRYRKGKTYAEFLGESEQNLLHNRYIWVSDIPKEKGSEWIGFLTVYQDSCRRNGLRPGVFILETEQETLFQKRKNIHFFVLEQYLTPYDKFAFCTLAASKTFCKENLKQYLAELVSGICSADAELCALCMKHGSAFLENPEMTIEKLCSMEKRSDGSRFHSEEIRKEIDAAIWEVQIKLLFPIIERYRRNFILRHVTEIEQVLPYTNSMNERVNDPMEVEIGMLCFLSQSGQVETSQREAQKLAIFREARNKLAHVYCLNLEDVEQMLIIGNKY